MRETEILRGLSKGRSKMKAGNNYANGYAPSFLSGISNSLFGKSQEDRAAENNALIAKHSGTNVIPLPPTNGSPDPSLATAPAPVAAAPASSVPATQTAPQMAQGAMRGLSGGLGNVARAADKRIEDIDTSVLGGERAAGAYADGFVPMLKGLFSRTPAPAPAPAPAPVIEPTPAPAPVAAAPAPAADPNRVNLFGGTAAGLRRNADAANAYSNGTAYLNGPGTGKSDSIPVNLSRGEAVLPAKTVDKLGPLNIARMIQETNDGIKPHIGAHKGMRAANGVTPLRSMPLPPNPDAGSVLDDVKQQAAKVRAANPATVASATTTAPTAAAAPAAAPVEPQSRMDRVKAAAGKLNPNITMDRVKAAAGKLNPNITVKGVKAGFKGLGGVAAPYMIGKAVEGTLADPADATNRYNERFKGAFRPEIGDNAFENAGKTLVQSGLGFAGDLANTLPNFLLPQNLIDTAPGTSAPAGVPAAAPAAAVTPQADPGTVTGPDGSGLRRDEVYNQDQDGARPLSTFPAKATPGFPKVGGGLDNQDIENTNATIRERESRSAMEPLVRYKRDLGMDGAQSSDIYQSRDAQGRVTYTGTGGEKTPQQLQDDAQRLAQGNIYRASLGLNPMRADGSHDVNDFERSLRMGGTPEQSAAISRGLRAAADRGDYKTIDRFYASDADRAKMDAKNVYDPSEADFSQMTLGEAAAAKRKIRTDYRNKALAIAQQRADAESASAGLRNQTAQNANQIALARELREGRKEIADADKYALDLIEKQRKANLDAQAQFIDSRFDTKTPEGRAAANEFQQQIHARAQGEKKAPESIDQSYINDTFMMNRIMKNVMDAGGALNFAPGNRSQNPEDYLPLRGAKIDKSGTGRGTIKTKMGPISINQMIGDTGDFGTGIGNTVGDEDLRDYLETMLKTKLD